MMAPDSTISSGPQSGGKKKKDRVTVGLTANADGSQKLRPIVIHKYWNPRCLAGINKASLGIDYHTNKTAWTTSGTFVKFLRWFDSLMIGRKVVLLLDNFSAHEAARNEVGGDNALKNVKILWLPKNATSLHQPMDQGIIQSFKTHYRKLFVLHMMKCMDTGIDPFSSANTNIGMAIH